VNERIRYFRSEYPTGSILTELVSLENGVCVMKASILIDGELRATGFAYEKEGSTFINKTSYIENCETSAVGRALGIFGIGIDTSVASAEEVLNAIENQKPKKVEKPTSDDFDNLVIIAEEHGKTYEDLEAFARKAFETSLIKINKDQYNVMLNRIKESKNDR
jgi:hypothetical protein